MEYMGLRRVQPLKAFTKREKKRKRKEKSRKRQHRQHSL